MFQSTHPHGVRLVKTRADFADLLVSIHAPARGATWLQQAWSPDSWFQSTHPHGVRPYHSMVLLLYYPVSIHAPARGATVTQLGSSTTTDVSIHAPAWGATLSTSALYFFFVFQSTHPHGVRLGNAVLDVDKLEFQSTHPHGVRPSPLRLIIRLLTVSIHAPARGATPSRGLASPSAQFQSTHPHGVRRGGTESLL